MPSERELHARFWAEAARKLDEGNLIPWILNEAAAEFEGTELAQPLEQVARDVEGGKDLWQALAGQSGAFSDTVWSMVRAADAAGTLAEAVRAIAEGTEDGALPVPGAGLGCDEDVAWWRCLGRLLGAGVPLLEAIRLVHNEVTADRLAEATRHIKAEMLKGRTMASAMRDLPEVFSKSQAFAVEMVEGSGGLAQRALEIADALPETDVGGLVVEGMEDIAAQQPVRKFVNTGLCIALSRGVSDIHVEPTESGRSRFRVRIDGVLTDLDWPEDVEVSGPVPHGEVINRIKIMAGMDLTQRQLPQDGRIEINLAGEPFDVRVSIVPTDFGERAVMRVLSRKWVPLDLAGLGILDDDLGALRALAHRPHGIVLCVGPTGSGKTTLAYAMLNELERDSICVMSIEDPVEYRLDGVAQIQVRPQAGLTFARAARGVFRQDPDVIFIGEIRDAEVANICCQFALTGHLVFTQLHTNTAPGALKRMVDIGVDPFVVNSSVIACIAQRLVRVLCRECRQPVAPVAHSLPPEASEFLEQTREATFYGPRGCEACNGTGYRGRRAIHEILTVGDAVRTALSRGGDLASLRGAAVSSGMRTLLECGLLNAAAGTTSLEEVLRVVPLGEME
jgi:general secretion pathway protein E